MKTNKVIGVLAAASLAMIANAEPFTYQGQLNDGGQPANGLYDISLQIKDAAVGGSVVGSGFAFANVDVVDGLFELEFDPGDVFDSSDVWLEITIDDAGNPVVLSPLTRITATPKAQHAMVADTALNAPWSVAPGVITYGDGDDRVFINRSGPITSAEVFGIHGTFSSFNGMYVSGPANSRPFYGYSTGGAVNAYTYYDSSTSEWRLNNTGDALVVDANHDLLVGNDLHVDQDVNAEAYKYNSPKTLRIAVSGNSFRPSITLQQSIGDRGNALGAYMSQAVNGSLDAPIYLPDGAKFVSMTVYCADTHTDSFLHVDLFAYHHAQVGGGNSVFALNTDGLSGSVLTIVDDTPISGVDTVDYSNRHYMLRAIATWPGDNTMSIGSVVIEYTIDEAN